MNYLEFLRRQRRQTQKELAQQLGLDAITMNRIERGWYARAPHGLAEAITRVFGNEWSFARLMREVPDITRPAADRAKESDR